jgi:outer membrane protein assembly factor BamD (BamD/ComL family)
MYNVPPMKARPTILAAVLAVLGWSGCASTSDQTTAYLDLCKQGQMQLKDGSYGPARSTFRTILSRYPGQPLNGEVELLLSDCENRLGNGAEARQLREKVAREATSRDLKLRANLSLGIMDIEKEWFDEAVSRFSAAQASADEASAELQATILCKKGIALQGTGRFQEARASFKKAIESAPNSPAAKSSRLQLLYPDYFTVQTGAFREAVNAERQRGELAGRGFPAEVVAVDYPQGKLHCVRVGKTGDREAAKKLLDRILAAKISDLKATIKP